MTPNRAALVGGLLIFPFLAANAIVGNRIEPFFSLIRPTGHTSALEYVVIAVVLGAIAAGAYVAARPMFEKRADGKRQVYPLNVVVAACMLALFVMLSAGLGADLYRCEVLRIPNCD